MQAGLGGTALFDQRPDDRFGVAYFQYEYNRDLRLALDRSVGMLGSESGVEAFYAWQLMPGLVVTGDVQRIMPARMRFDPVTVLGVRVVVRI